MTQKCRRDYQRVQYIALGNAGVICREISTIAGISKSSVQRAFKRFEKELTFLVDNAVVDRKSKIIEMFVY